MPWQSLHQDDARLDPLRALPQGAGARTQALIIEGEIVLERVLALGYTPSLLVATPAVAPRLREAAKQAALACVLEEREMMALAGYAFHRGCLAVVPRPMVTSLREQLVTLARKPDCRVVAFDRIADGANVGALLRTTWALGVDLVLLGPGCADPWSRRALRASMGHALAQPLAHADELAAAMRETAKTLPGLQWWCTRCDDDAQVLDGNPPSRLGLVFGSEGTGVSAEVSASCVRGVRIALAHGVDSLNVGSAAAVVLWALRS